MIAPYLAPSTLPECCGLLVQPVSSDGWLYLGRSAVGRHFATTLKLTCLVYCLDSTMPFYSLNKSVRLPLNSCICTEIRLHTAELFLIIRSSFSHLATRNF